MSPLTLISHFLNGITGGNVLQQLSHRTGEALYFEINKPFWNLVDDYFIGLFYIDTHSETLYREMELKKLREGTIPEYTYAEPTNQWYKRFILPVVFWGLILYALLA